MCRASGASCLSADAAIMALANTDDDLGKQARQSLRGFKAKADAMAKELPG